MDNSAYRPRHAAPDDRPPFVRDPHDEYQPRHAAADNSPSCCGGTGIADYAAVPCPALGCPAAVALFESTDDTS
jgi:hypothetical protein